MVQISTSGKILLLSTDCDVLCWVKQDTLYKRIKMNWMNAPSMGAITSDENTIAYLWNHIQNEKLALVSMKDSVPDVIRIELPSPATSMTLRSDRSIAYVSVADGEICALNERGKIVNTNDHLSGIDIYRLQLSIDQQLLYAYAIDGSVLICDAKSLKTVFIWGAEFRQPCVAAIARPTFSSTIVLMADGTISEVLLTRQ